MSNKLKPILIEQNKIDRVRWLLYMFCPETLEFSSMRDYIVVDKKWFYMSETTRTFYLGNDEPEPEHSGKSSRCTPKVMFLAAIARPLYDKQGYCVFDGNIGFWSFVEMVAAKRNSKNRPAGTFEVKPVNVTRDVYRTLIVEKFIPAIRENCPMRRSKRVVMQQDNAPSHVSIDDQIIVEEGRRHR